MFSLYIVWYLFLAGTGSGAYAIAATLGFVGQASGRRSIQEYGHIADGGFYLGPALVFIGAVFLLFDLGSPEKAWLVVIGFRLSILTIGVWTILLFLLVASLLVVLKRSQGLMLPRLANIILQVLALALALAVMVYAGIFLATIKAIPFLNHWLLVALLVLSSLAAGSATITLYGFFNQHHKAMHYALRLIPRLDAPLIGLEAIALAAFLGAALLGGGLTHDCAGLLVWGDKAVVFWVGAVALGLLIPLLVMLYEGNDPRPVPLALSSALVLVGGFALRWCVVAAGIHISQL